MRLENMTPTIENIALKKIFSCIGCEYSGHIVTSETNTIFVCCNPVHEKMIIARKFIGQIAYPIVAVELNNPDKLYVCPVPKWCTISKEGIRNKIFDCLTNYVENEPLKSVKEVTNELTEIVFSS
jgi:hypothetical protein